jgi:hypothetical protein
MSYTRFSELEPGRMLHLDLVDVTGSLGLAINAYSLTRNSDNALRALIGVGFVVWSLNNWLLGAYSAAALCLVAATRQGVAVLVARKDPGIYRHVWFGVFMAAVVGSSLATWKGWGTAYACLSSTLSTIAMFYLAGPHLRLTVAAAYALWALTTWYAGSTWGVVANLMLTSTAFYAFLKLRRESKRNALAASAVN